MLAIAGETALLTEWVEIFSGNPWEPRGATLKEIVTFLRLEVFLAGKSSIRSSSILHQNRFDFINPEREHWFKISILYSN